MKTLDGCSGTNWIFPSPSSSPCLTNGLPRLVHQAVEENRKEQAEAEKRKVVFHLDQLDRIRQDAAVTRDKLMTEEERREEVLPAIPEQPDPSATWERGNRLAGSPDGSDWEDTSARASSPAGENPPAPESSGLPGT